MAIIYPSIETIKNQKIQPTDAEKALLNSLYKYLDSTYEIFYHPYLDGDRPDIVIARKNSGILIVEVKDWELKNYCIKDCYTWLNKSNGQEIKSPFMQVQSYKKHLFNLHCIELFNKNLSKNDVWRTVNCVVYFHKATLAEIQNLCFPKSPTDKNTKSSNTKYIEQCGILGCNTLTEEGINYVLKKFRIHDISKIFEDKLYFDILRYLKPPHHQIEEGHILNYSETQKLLIKSEIRPRRKIKGVAGSGKTLVLAQRAVNAQKRTNSQVLILTYNLSLKNYIHDKLNDIREEFNWSNFYITNYHQFIKTQANNYGLSIQRLSSWENVDLFEPVKIEIQKYDVVLIDEVQDYAQTWLDIICKYFIHQDTEFVVFGDEKQNIYERKLDENNEPIVRTISGVWNKSLNTSYRFSSNIGNIALLFQKAYLGYKYSIDDLNFMAQLDFEERIIEYHYFNNFTTEILFNSIYTILEKHQIHSSDVAILSSKIEILRTLDLLIRTIQHERTSVTFETQEEFEQVQGKEMAIEGIRRFRKNHFYMETGTIKLSTVHSFKGWEIDTLFLLIENEKELVNSELIYTGITRARRNLIIFNLGNFKYNDFFKSKIDSQFEHC